MSFIKRLFPPYCPSGSSYDSFNEKGYRICKKDGDETTKYRLKRGTDCDPTIKDENYELIVETDEDDCDRKNMSMPSGSTGKRGKRKSYKTSKGLSSCPDKQKFYPNSQRTCKKRKMVWHKKSKRCTLKKR